MAAAPRDLERHVLTRRNALSSINGPRGRRASRRHRRATKSPQYRRRGLGVGGVVVVLVVGVALGIGGISLFRTIRGNPVPVRVIGVDGPLAGASIARPDGESVVTGENGSAGLEFSAPAMLSVSAPGYETGMFDVQAIPNPGPLFLQLNPVVMQGKVVGPNGEAVPRTTVRIGDKETLTDDLGSFEFVAAKPGTVSAEKAAWLPGETEWDGAPGRLTVTIEPFLVRGLRVSGQAAGDPAAFAEILDLVEASSVNALVFDTKTEGGEVVHDTKVQEAIDIGAVKPVYAVEDALAEAKARGLYAITRIVTFQDFYRALARPEHAISNTETGEVWANVKGLGWMDPTDREAWTYPIALAKEACEMGFDEVQFDYVRFPTDGDVAVAGYDGSPITSDVRIETIAGFLATARDELNALGCAASADIFGIVMSVNDDQGLGQLPEVLSYSVDAVSPMVYPSHYGRGWMGLDNPNDHPYDVVAEAITSGMSKLEGGAVLRPWLQAFSWTGEEILDSIAAAEDNGLGWLLWNSLSTFEEGSLPPTG